MFYVGGFFCRGTTHSHALANTLLSALMLQCLGDENAKWLGLIGPPGLLKGTPVLLLKNNIHQQRPPTMLEPLA